MGNKELIWTFISILWPT